MQTYSLFDLNEHIRRVVALNFPDPVWIIAEIAESNLSNGHLYLNLIQKIDAEIVADAGIIAQAQATVWYRERKKIASDHGPVTDTVLQIGCQVRILVKISFHERYGLKLNILDIDPAYTLGVAALHRRQTIEQLQKKGLLHRNAQLPLPSVIQRVAIVTSSDAAGFHDFKTHLEENSYGYQFQLSYFFSSVQGKNAEREIIASLNKINLQNHLYDAVVIVRGGGSKIDLAAFDGLELCSAVAMMSIPVFTGIGHEIDESVLDLTAHSAFKTPTAVADFLIERSAHFEITVNQLIYQIGQQSRIQTQRAQTEVHSLHLNLQYAANSLMAGSKQKLDQFIERLELSAQHRLNTEHQLLAHTRNILSALAPETILKRGYSITLKNGKIVNDHTQTQTGDLIETKLAKGSVLSRVE